MINGGAHEYAGIPMPLRHWLATWTHAERLLLARLWSLPATVAQTPDLLAEALLQPLLIERMLMSLGDRERDALLQVQLRGGSIPALVLERAFGSLRRHEDYPNPRAYLLALAPPPSPVERLYTLALIQRIPHGTHATYAIPPDLLALLPAAPPVDPPHIHAITTAPLEKASGNIPLTEHWMITLLTLAYDGQLHVTANGQLNKASRARLARAWADHALDHGIYEEDRALPQFLYHISLNIGLLRADPNARLTPTRAALEWLQRPLLERMRWLLRGWSDSAWDELQIFGGVTLQHAYGRDLASIKQAILNLLAAIPFDHWIDRDRFVAQVKHTNPDFARPDGRYDTWGLRDHLRRPIDGFAHWDQVEGLHLRLSIGITLRWLGLVDIGLQAQGPSSFRITALGAALFGSTSAFVAPPEEPLLIQPNFDIVIPVYASPYARFQVGRISERHQKKTTATLTKRSIQTALAHGIGIEDILQFLHNQSAHDVPQNIVVTLREWAAHYGQVSLRRAMLLEVQDALLFEQIRRDKRIRLPHAERLTDRAWLVRESDAPALATGLRKAGYGVSVDDLATETPLSEHDLAALFTALEFYIQASDMVGYEHHASAAMRRRMMRLLPDRQLNRAFQSSHEALQHLKAWLEKRP